MVPNLCKHRPEWEKEGPERVVLPRVEGKVGKVGKGPGQLSTGSYTSSIPSQPHPS